MKVVVCAVFTVFTLILSGCVRAPFQPPAGAITTSYQAPLDLEYDETSLGTKRGEASVTTILGLISTGDASTKAAAENGGITEIDHADYDYMNVLGIYQKTTVIVYGK